MDGPMKEIIVVKIKAVHASRKRWRGCAAGARGLCAMYDIKRIAFAKTAEEWPSRPCSRTFMAFRDSVLCTVGLAGPCTSYANTFFFCESATLHKCVFSRRPYLKKLNFSKGQLISKGLFKVFICTKKQTKLFLYFCPSL